MLTEKDLEDIKKRGSDIDTVNTQLEKFRTGFPYIKLVEPAEVGNGIVKLTDAQLSSLEKEYDQNIQQGIEVMKFVPASGAASRMFKALYNAKEKLEQGTSEAELLKDAEMDSFVAHLKYFAFYNDLSSKAGKPAEELSLLEVLDALLTTKGLDYGGLPKGLLKFHMYADKNRTPFQEHCVEGALYAKQEDGKVQIHFTVSPEHKEKFTNHLAEVIKQHEDEHNVAYTIDFSYQDPATDTIAVEPDNSPFRKENKELLFRPAGHGALLKNLNELDADIIFVKNIDNVVPDYLKGETVKYKKALAGYLLDIQKEIFTYQKRLDTAEAGTLSEAFLDEAIAFLANRLNTKAQSDNAFASVADKLSFAKEKLNRPIRVCGMVVNEGEPGGGPFWTKNNDGSISLQVVESSQIDFNDAKQSDIAKSATHFNPVDLICAVRNHKGEKYNLLNYVDADTGFISSKSMDGRELKAQELPGLWNGSMSDWNTIFVEVPSITFNPVKTVNDLLRLEHQPKQ